MIAFDLRCSENHTFEAWFKDRAAFEEQRDRGLISCPVCGCHQVEKILSPVAIRRSPSSHAPDQTAGDGLEIQKGFLKAMQKIYETVIENTEDVGARFASEALKMHYGATESRNIRGVATEDEEKILKDEGIDFARIPVPPGPAKKEEIN